MSTNTRNAWLLGGALVLGAVILSLAFVRQLGVSGTPTEPAVLDRPVSATSSSTPPPTLAHYTAHPVFTASDAVTEALSYFPEGSMVEEYTAKLVTYAVLDRWRKASSPLTMPQAPVWLVGFSAEHITSNDVLMVPSGGPPLGGRGTPVEGMFVAIDASSGDITGYGVLGQDPDMSYASIVALEEVPQRISSATPIPWDWPGSAQATGTVVYE